MKVQIVAHTPVGKFVSVVGEETTVEKVKGSLNMLKEDLTSFTFNTENGTILLKNEVINNSVFEIITVEE